jgi:hypothetical protein
MGLLLDWQGELKNHANQTSLIVLDCTQGALAAVTPGCNAPFLQGFKINPLVPQKKPQDEGKQCMTSCLGLEGLWIGLKAV